MHHPDPTPARSRDSRSRGLHTLARAAILGIVLALFFVAPATAGDKKLDLTYSILVEHDGSVKRSDFLRAFEDGDRFRLEMTFGQDVVLYIIASKEPGTYELLLPNRGTDSIHNTVEDDTAFHWPHRDAEWMRLDDQPGVERIYLVVASERITELETVYAREESEIPERLLFDIRDRYQADSDYRRRLEDDEVEVRFRSKSSLPAVLIEEIVFRHR